MARRRYERESLPRGGGSKGGDPQKEALGYSRGGFGTKLHLLCDGFGNPLAAVLSPGQRHESLFLEDLVAAGEKEAGRRPERLAADRGYSAPRIRGYLQGRGIEPVIPHRKDELDRMEAPPEFDEEGYKGRNAVERLVGWLKEARCVATRFDKFAESYMAMVQLAMIRLMMRRILPSNSA